MPEAKTLGEFISARREELRLEQKDISQRLKSYGVDRATTTVAGWENGMKIPMEMIPALAKALEVSPVPLYELAGILSQLPGSELVKLVDGMSEDDIKHVEDVIRALLKKK